MFEVKVLYSVGAVDTSILITGNSNDLLVDAGDGTLRDLFERKYDFGRLAGILITHESLDHISGLLALLKFMGLLKTNKTITITVPKSPNLIYDFMKLMSKSKGSADIIPTHILEMEHSDVFLFDELEVKAFSVRHKGKCLGYTIRDIRNGYKAVFSGDTAPCENLLAEVTNADIAVLDGSFTGYYWKRASRDMHMTIGEAKIIGKAAKKVILIHQIPVGYFKTVS